MYCKPRRSRSVLCVRRAVRALCTTQCTERKERARIRGRSRRSGRSDPPYHPLLNATLTHDVVTRHCEQYNDARFAPLLPTGALLTDIVRRRMPKSEGDEGTPPHPTPAISLQTRLLGILSGGQPPGLRQRATNSGSPSSRSSAASKATGPPGERLTLRCVFSQQIVSIAFF